MASVFVPAPIGGAPNLRDAVLRLLGPAPARLAVPCERCGAPSGEECRWRRAPGPPNMHGERRRRRDGLADAHEIVLRAVVVWAMVVSWGGSDRGPAVHARARYRALAARAESTGWPVRPLPDPADVLAAARAEVVA